MAKHNLRVYYSQLQAELRLEFYASLVIHQRPRVPGRVGECARPRLRSSPRDPASQTTTPHSYSSPHSLHHHPTPCARAHVHRDFPLRARRRGVAVVAVAGGGGGDGGGRRHCVAARPGEKRGTTHSRRCYCSHLRRPPPPSPGNPPGSQ